jgi:hypothetical protein
MRAASSDGDRPVQAKCLVCVGDIQRSQNNNEVGRESYTQINRRKYRVMFDR